ncbi:L-threonylcarbamoyladenylate synthase [Streptococcus massiliensis]|uniref:L-threonylcarbamoyladenylate synthase n=1 Tax=Streptococcus massiliensis TaxID=313439 RepID=A0A380KXR0_9STRE|nr:L-threonylcarbamoyladenylate synthase [Streptococcus massiliensis]SUN76069.1 putative tranlsation factor [Streptococcus massiliensis]
MDELARILAKGGALVLPTETVYGLFAQALDQAAVEHVYQLKSRPRDKALNLNVASLADILAFSQNQPDYLSQLYDAFLPGPLTIILEANERVPAWVNSGMKTVGFRIPSHPQTLELIRQFGPLIGPSANISGQASGISYDQIMADFGGKVIGIKDDAFLTGQDSTILDLSGDQARILRQGAISKEELQAAIPQLVFDDRK